MVWPSGADLATACAAMIPPAPGLLSTTPGCPSFLDMRSANSRATRSLVLPGASAPTTLRGRLPGRYLNRAKSQAQHGQAWRAGDEHRCLLVRSGVRRTMGRWVGGGL